MMTDHKHVKQLLEACCVHQTIDSLYFGGPALQLLSDHSSYDEVILRIEGTFELIQNGEKTVVTCETSDKLVYLTAHTHQKIASVQLIEPNDLVIVFVSGMKLRVVGDNGQFESWKLQASVEDDKVLLVAGPDERLSLFE